jgi:SAM-dependent methyltransferase
MGWRSQSLRFHNPAADTGRGDASGIESNTVDLVTVGQALHWFELPQFYAEVSRILKPGGVFAAFGEVFAFGGGSTK